MKKVGSGSGADPDPNPDPYVNGTDLRIRVRELFQNAESTTLVYVYAFLTVALLYS